MKHKIMCCVFTLCFLMSFINLGHSDSMKADVVKMSSENAIFIMKTAPLTESSVENLKTFGDILYESPYWCILRYFSPLEGIGYGSIIVYRHDKTEWRRFKTFDNLLLPDVIVDGNKVAITKEKNLNNATRVTAYNIVMDKGSIQFILPDGG